MPEPILTFRIAVDGPAVSGFSGPFGAVTFIPFRGTADSPLFRGEIAPGAADVQTELPGEPRRLCARYLFRGTDADGRTCSLYEENTGSLTGEPGPIRCTPSFLTDSPLLAETFRGRRFCSEVSPSEGGVTVTVFAADE